jgi:hypothetical protein
MEQGLRFGSMLPYADTAFKEGYAVIVCNPTANTVTITDPQTGAQQQASAVFAWKDNLAGTREITSSLQCCTPGDVDHTECDDHVWNTDAGDDDAADDDDDLGPGGCIQVPIEGSSTPEQHVMWVYSHLIVRSSAEHVFLIGYGYGAKLCKEILLQSLMVRPLGTLWYIHAVLYYYSPLWCEAAGTGALVTPYRVLVCSTKPSGCTL